METGRDIAPYSLALFASALTALVIAIITWRRRSAPGALPLFIMLVTTVLWAGANGMQLEATTLQQRVFWFNILSVGALCGTPALLAFALQYTGREGWLTRRNTIVISILPIAGVLLTWTNDFHHIFYAEIDFTTSAMKAAPGIGYNIYLAYSYPLVIYTLGIIVQAYIRSPRAYRGQTGAILFGTLIPFIGNIIHNIINNGSAKGQMDPTPILFTFMGLFYAYGLFAYRLFELVPVARHTLVERMADGVLVVDSQNRIIDINPAAIRLLELPPHSSIGLTLDQLAFPFPDGATQRTEVTLEGPPLRYLDVRSETLLDGQNQPNGRLIVLRDITTQKQTEKALEASEANLHRLLEAAPDAMFIVNPAGSITFANAQSEVMFGYASHELVDQPIEILMPERFSEIHKMHRANYHDEPEALSADVRMNLYLVGRRRDGVEFPVEISLNPLPTDQGIFVMTAVRDITERKRIEAEREKLIVELEKRNAESESLRETTVIVTSTLDISEAVQRILKQLKRVIAYDTASVWLYKDNKVHLVGGDGIPDIPEQDKHFKISEREPDYPLWTQNLQYILLEDVQKDFPQFREPPINYIHGWLGVPLKVRGNLIGIISLDSRTIGRFTHADAQLASNYANQVSIALEHAQLFSDLQNELHQRQELIDKLDSKNSELESFTYSVSHDLKSPLITIKGFLGFLKDDIAAGNAPRAHTDLQRISGAMDIMQERLDDLLELSRAGRLTDKLEVIRFEDLVAAALELVHGRISQHSIKVWIHENLPSIKGDRHRLLEVMQNLMDNAAKFMGEQTDPVIEIGQYGEEEGNPIFFVKDNGMGIPPEHHEKIFGIFNKLDTKAEGTGIGLALVKKIIEAHGGRIWVESVPSQGSTFYFSLPRG